MKYSMTCTCGDVMSVEADDREEAVSKLSGMMTQSAINKHFAEKHSGEMPTTEAEEAAMIEKTLAPAM